MIMGVLPDGARGLGTTHPSGDAAVTIRSFYSTLAILAEYRVNNLASLNASAESGLDLR